ncbi:MAG: YafY family transcriptional regulator [Bacteroidales bacterium]|nr:YafY family transcriptional regulator [Bacteroidales bacterium]
MNRIDRISAILIQLQTKKYITAGEIAERFFISKRTVYRDLKALEEAGIPLGAEPGRGYFLVEGFHLPPVMFTSHEANALLIAGKMVEKFTDQSVSRQFESALYKIKSVLPEKEKQLLADLHTTIQVFYSPAAEPSPGYLSDLQLAVAQRRTLTIDYRSQYKEEHTKNRIIEPIGICFYSMNWHLIAYCRMREEYRDFRIDRIQSLKTNEEVFIPKNRLSMHEYFSRLTKEADLTEVILRFDKSTAAVLQNIKYYYGFVSEEKIGDQTEMDFLVNDLNYFGRWLLMFADGMEVISPIELKNILKDLIRKIRMKQE